MCSCMYAFLSLCIFLVSSPPHHSTDLLSLPGASGRPLSFSNNITGRSARPAQQEVRSSWLWNSLILKRLLVPPSRSRGHSLRLHLRTSQPWPPFPASFAKYSFCFVQVVAGGGGGVVRSSYSQKRRSVGGKYYHRKHMRSKGWESFGVLDYICQGNETEQKLSNIKLFKCIPRVLNTAFFPQRLRADSDYIFPLWETLAKCDICEVSSKMWTPTLKKDT